MITWICGQSKSGKSTLAKYILNMISNSAILEYNKPIWLDGDIIRQLWSHLKWSKEDRYTNNMKFAYLAKVFHEQGHDVIVSTICPYRELRDKIRRYLGYNIVTFVYLDGGVPTNENYPYEPRQEGEGEEKCQM